MISDLIVRALAGGDIGYFDGNAEYLLLMTMLSIFFVMLAFLPRLYLLILLPLYLLAMASTVACLMSMARHYALELSCSGAQAGLIWRSCTPPADTYFQSDTVCSTAAAPELKERTGHNLR